MTQNERRSVIGMRRWLALGLATAFVMGLGVASFASRVDAGTTLTRLTAGVIEEPQNGDIHVHVFNPTSTTVHVVFALNALSSTTWSNANQSFDIQPHTQFTFNAQCQDVTGCVAFPTVSPRRIVPSGEYKNGGGYIGIPAGVWRAIR
jgi:hypothetical protein